MCSILAINKSQKGQIRPTSRRGRIDSIEVENYLYEKAAGRPLNTHPDMVIIQHVDYAVGSHLILYPARRVDDGRQSQTWILSIRVEGVTSYRLAA